MNAAVIVASVLGGITIGVLCMLGYMQNRLWAKLDTMQRSFDRIETTLKHIERLVKERHGSSAA